MQPGQSIALSAGTTTWRLAQHLADPLASDARELEILAHGLRRDAEELERQLREELSVVVGAERENAEAARRMKKTALKSDAETKGVNLIGYISHVQGELKVQAQQDGCDMVLARSAFSQNLPQLLKRFA